MKEIIKYALGIVVVILVFRVVAVVLGGLLGSLFGLVAVGALVWLLARPARTRHR